MVWPWRLLGAAGVGLLAATSQAYGVNKHTLGGVIIYLIIIAVNVGIALAYAWSRWTNERPLGEPVTPSATAPSRNDSTLRYCGSVATGLISVSAALGSPSRIDRARSAILATSSSWTPRLTSSRSRPCRSAR